ncbi:hypothetical protein SDJN02_05539, partial [Cucurbita argyrosperma subsp. argyrosperma]
MEADRTQLMEARSLGRKRGGRSVRITQKRKGKRKGSQWNSQYLRFKARKRTAPAKGPQIRTSTELLDLKSLLPIAHFLFFPIDLCVFAPLCTFITLLIAESSGGVADNAPLDYARIQLIPSENRYEAFVYCGNEVDALAEGNLDALLLHLPDVQELNSKGSKASIKLQLPASSAGATWFTKSTLSRFLHVVGSPELTNIMKTMNEMAQLEDTKRFHLSLYGQGQMSKTEEKGNSRNPFGVML